MAAKGAKGGRGRRLVVPWWLILAVACFVVGVGVGTRYFGGAAAPDTQQAREAAASKELESATDSPAAGGTASPWPARLAWLSPLCLALVAALFLMQRRSRMGIQALRDDLSRLERPRSAREPEGAPYPSHSEPPQLRKDVNQMQEDIKALRLEMQARSGADGSGAAARAEPAGTAERPARPVFSPPFARTDVKVLSGILSADDHVRLTSASRPMLEIRWREGDTSAEVWVNPEFKFADLTADLLESAYDVDAGGPGAYETLAPALIEWSAGANSGRVTRRGRVRALRS